MNEYNWDYSIDGQLEDEVFSRIDNVDWGDVEKYGLDSFLVGLAVGTKHVDAKITLSGQLIDIHKQHAKQKKDNAPSNNRGLLPENFLNRMVFNMISACAGNAPGILLQLLSLRMGVSRRRQKGIQDEVAHRNLLHVVSDNPNIGKKTAASIVGISPNTAKKWMDRPEFMSTVKIIQKHGIKGVK